MLFKEVDRHAKGVGHRSVLIVGFVRSQFSMFFLNVHHDSQRLFLGLFECSSSGSF